MDSPAISADQVDPIAAFAVAVDRVATANPGRRGLALAAIIGCSPPNVCKVLQRKGRCPETWVHKLSLATGVPASLLRPDLDGGA